MVPDYRILLWVWKLATKLLMPSLRVAVLGAYSNYQRFAFYFAGLLSDQLSRYALSR